jgi:replicative DNA helicase
MHSKDKLLSAYGEAIDGVNTIRIKDIHGWSSYKVEDFIRETRPCLVVFDMIDHIKFSGEAAGARTDQALESMYKEVREWGVKYDAIMLATSQISADGSGMLFPAMHMLKESKVGKQGAADFMIMIGRSEDFNSESLRGIGLPKNKLRIAGMPGDPRAEVLFDGTRAQFTDVD